MAVNMFYQFALLEFYAKEDRYRSHKVNFGKGTKSLFKLGIDFILLQEVCKVIDIKSQVQRCLAFNDCSVKHERCVRAL